MELITDVNGFRVQGFAPTKGITINQGEFTPSQTMACAFASTVTITLDV